MKRKQFETPEVYTYACEDLIVETVFTGRTDSEAQ